MKSQEFCYWLQGCLELNPEMPNFSAKQMSCIEKHLELTLKYDTNPNAFVRYLQSVFLALDGNLPSVKLFNAIKNELNSVFLHEIDLSYGGEEIQNYLNNIHNSGTTPLGDKLTIRC